MARAYTPGLKVTRREQHRCRRVLPIPGDVLVNVGDHVQARDIVAETFMPGDITPINVANILSMPPKDVADCMLKREGEEVQIGDVLARTPGIFGFFKHECKAKVAGTIESISEVTGQVIIRGAPIPVQVCAYLTGTVVEVIPQEGVEIEAEVTFVQGIFGVGGEAFGPLRLACREPTQDLTPELILPDMREAVIVGGARMTGATVKRAIEVGAAGIISGGMDDQDLRDILGYDLGVAITGSEEIGLTLLVTEGFGDIAMAKQTFELLASREGAAAAINGTTQIRAGVVRPEIVIPWTKEDELSSSSVGHTAGDLRLGTPIRVIRDPFFGQLGKVHALPPELRALDSGSRARVLEVELVSGEHVIVPRANVEIIAE